MSYILRKPTEENNFFLSINTMAETCIGSLNIFNLICTEFTPTNRLYISVTFQK